MGFGVRAVGFLVSGFGAQVLGLVCRATYRLPEKQRTPATMSGGDSFPARLLMRPCLFAAASPRSAAECAK